MKNSIKDKIIELLNLDNRKEKSITITEKDSSTSIIVTENSLSVLYVDKDQTLPYIVK